MIEPEPDLFSELEPEFSDEDQVVALERSLLADDVRTDRAAMAALLHEDWHKIGPSGRHWRRDDFLDEVGALESPADLEVLDVRRVAPDAILLVWRSTSDGEAAMRSSLWVRTGNTWQQIFHQGTPTA